MRLPLIFLVSIACLGLVSEATGAPIVETLNPSVYQVQAGGVITLRGSISFPDTASYQYGFPAVCGGCFDEVLFGLTPTAPHLGILGGSLVLSLAFSSSPYFEDEFLGPAGFLGPTSQVGPATTAVTDWREFVVPLGTPPGIYDYSYGITYTENGGIADGISFATNLEVDVVTPEPASFLLLAAGLTATAWRRRMTCLERF